MSITDELNQLIAEHGSARDALNVTLAKLRQAQSEIAVLKEAAEQERAVDVLPCGHTADNLVVNAVTSWCDACETAHH